MNGNSLELKKINIKLKEKTLFDDFNLTVSGGEIVALMGASGAGKSTLLSFVTGMIEPVFEYSGEIILNRLNISTFAPEKRKIGIMFQDALLFPHMNVLENIRFGTPAHYSRKQKQKLAQAMLEKAELSDWAKSRPATLSGGQQARVALMRTLISEPLALMLDEPFSNLDMELRERLSVFIKKLVKDSNLPVILVTHDKIDAERVADRLLSL